MGQPQYMLVPTKVSSRLLMKCRCIEYQTCAIIAGKGVHEKMITVPRAALEKSPVIRGWIQDTDSMPGSLKKNGALYLPEYAPTVVLAVTDCLKSVAYDFKIICDPSAGSGRDAFFFLDMYKLCLCLG
jgi:hypothetical protein